MAARDPSDDRPGLADLEPAARRTVVALAAEAGWGEDDAENALRALELSFEGVLLVDASQRIVHANRRAREMTGARSEELVGRRCAEGMRFLTCGERCLLFEQNAVCGRSCEAVRRDGGPLHLVKNGRVLRGGDGAPAGGLESMQDVTDLFRSAERLRGELRRAEGDGALLETLAGTLAEAVLVAGRDGRVRAASEPAAAWLGVPAARLAGAEVAALFRERERVARALGAADAEPRETGPVHAAAGGPPARLRLSLLAGTDGPRGLVVHVQPEPEGRENARHGIVGRSPAILHLARAVARRAGGDEPVLVTGESGTGKSLVARALHLAGPRRARPFLVLDCADPDEARLEGELFGHERGAIAGAVAARPGRLELAGDGTLLLDGIDRLPAGLQAGLLRALEQGRFERRGGRRPRPLRARIVAATSADLAARVRAGAFRAELWQRLRAAPLEVPPLRERREDVVPLARHFAREIAPGGPALGAAAESALLAWGWPGNVRELRTAVAHALATCAGRVAGVEHLPAEIRRASALAGAGDPERERIENALREARFHHGRAAQALGVSRTTLWRRLKQLGIR